MFFYFSECTVVENSPSIKSTSVYRSLFLFFFFKSTFNFSQTVGELVFVSFEVETIRKFLV